MSSMRRPTKNKSITSAAQSMQKVSKQEVQLNVRITPEMKRDLRRLAADQDTAVTEIVTDLIRKHLANNLSN
ncbi:hypothetical protein FRC0036_02145 [Corynebacterium diphtheriae]|uniref:hypothetical protein n=1 Tax=Corynebacterium diphtheriae TaxID=1717 RepID=UPI000245B8BA|nr:hypothetical protein [Corynebacterium diphtheriae]AEX48240.1 hypothetical protein CDBH8_0715 [Corynebacterium diphtheriae BH8]AEX80646.1 hypothetical protein CDHC04_0653 [Corynebacterium diphtheriae HC04]MBG9277858.1 hypothetical protein [Corynebacterium diphtheriae bv. mitis]MBG9282304.1 hypothetical protein [Corynebacterium diphtheriae bv. mitis]CAB0530624.1 hypothetical protein CIP101352_02319 [Corynebacterium diphtheriae]